MSDPAELPPTVARGVGSVGLLRLVRNALMFVVMIVVARAIGPSAFGLFALALVVLSLGDLLVDGGLSPALVERRDLTPEHLAAAGRFNLIVGAGSAAILALAASPMAQALGQPGLAPLLWLGALAFVPASLALPRRALLTRELTFTPVAVIDLVAAVGNAATTLVLVITLDVGAIGPAAGLVVERSIAAGALLAVVRRPHARPTLSSIRDLWRYGRGVVGFSLLNLLSRQADDLLVGRFLGAAALGFYNRAYQTMLIPVAQVSQVGSAVFFPVLARLADEPDRFLRAYRRVVQAIALVVFPAMALLAATAHDAVLLVFGEEWMPMVTTLRVLVVLGAVQAVGSTVGWVFQALGRTGAMFRYSLLAVPLTVVAFVVGVMGGRIELVAGAYAVTSLALLPVSVRSAAGNRDLRAHDLLGWLATPFTGSVLVAGVGVAVTAGLASSPPLLRLSASVLAGGGVYVGFMSWRRPPALHDVAAVLRSGVLKRTEA